MSLKLTLGPYLSLDMEDTWETLAIKLGWSVLHRQYCALSSQPPPNSITILPELLSQVNVGDFHDWTPLFYAALRDSEAVNSLLIAGANPRHNHILIEVARTGRATVISMIVRAGAHINASHSTKRTALQWALHSRLLLPNASAFVIASELIRHAGHMLDWDIRDTFGLTALEWAQMWVNKNPNDDGLKRTLELYRRHRILQDEQYLPTSSSLELEDTSGPAGNADMGLPSTSLIRAGLRGDINAIGDLIRQGAMVNERYLDGRTLLHFIALGWVPNGYRIALELVWHGGWGVDWRAMIFDDDGIWTPLRIAEDRLRQHGLKTQGNDPGEPEDRRDRLSDGDVEEIDPDADTEGIQLTDSEYEELTNIRDLLKARRLPPGEKYLWPCMDPDFYIPKPEPRMPGSFDDD